MSELEERVRKGLHAELNASIEFHFRDRNGRFPLDACESPIERGLAVMITLLAHLRGNGTRLLEKGVLLPNDTVVDGRDTLRLAPQYPIRKYRVDLLVGFSGAGTLDEGYIAVECDGHDFHEKTREQAQRDKSRDRILSSEVAKVIRFTGSEIYKDPWACANEVLDMATMLWYRKTGGAR